jgi:hypothetical protein
MDYRFFDLDAVIRNDDGVTFYRRDFVIFFVEAAAFSLVVALLLPTTFSRVCRRLQQRSERHIALLANPNFGLMSNFQELFAPQLS